MTEQEMTQDARQDAAEIMKCGIIDISMCRECNDKGTLFEADTVTTLSRLNYQFCNVCCRYQETPYLVEVNVESVVDYRFVRTEDSTSIYKTVYKVSKCEVLI